MDSASPSFVDPTAERCSSALAAAVTQFRLAIERCDPKDLSVCMQDFPRGSCGDATLLLGTYLAMHGFGTFRYILGERGRRNGDGWHSHAWLESDAGLIIDITADQFPEIDQKVIITHRSPWHASFEREKVEQPADYRIYDQGTAAMLARAFYAISAELDRALQVDELAALKAELEAGLADVASGRVTAFDAARIIEGGKVLADRSPSV